MAEREPLQQSLLRETQRYQSRRWFFKECGVGLGSVALHSLLGSLLGAGTALAGTAQAGPAPARTGDPLAPKAPHFAAKAKRVIYLFQAGAPSHLELFDHKPELAKWDGKLPPAELLKGYRAAFINPNSKLLGPKFKFAKHGQCGAELSELLPHTGQDRRRHRHRQVDADRRLQPRAGADFHEHRRAAVRPAEHGRVGHLRPGQRSAGPAGLRRLQYRPEGHQRRPRQLWLRLPADRLPGRAVPRAGRSGPLPLEPARRRRDHAARHARRHPRPQRAAARRGRRPRDRHAHQLVRDGVSDAGERAGSDGPVEGIARDAGDVRRRAGRSRASPTTACWPGGSSSAACASSRSSTRPGTTTAASSAA